MCDAVNRGPSPKPARGQSEPRPPFSRSWVLRKRWRLSLWCVVFWGLTLLAGAGCGEQGGPTIVVHTSGIPSGTQALRFSATLNGVAIRNVDNVAAPQAETLYPLSAEASGAFSVDVRALGSEGCAMAVGHGEATVMAGSRDRIVLMVSLEGRTPPLCAVEVQITGSGTLTSNPTGLACGQAHCSLEVPAGTQISMLAKPAARAYFAGWSGACAGPGLCKLLVNRPSSIRAEFYPQLCTANDICWESPLPADINLYGLWGSGPSDLFAVGDGGQILHYDGSAFSIVNSPTVNNLRAVWGSGPKDVFAVGAGGTVLHFDGSSWSIMQLPGAPLNALSCLAGTGPNDVYAAGSGGAVFHYDGSTWSKIATAFPNDLAGIYASENLLLLVAANGEVFKRTGGQFSFVGSNTGGLFGVSGSADNNILAVGDSGTLQLFNGSALIQQTGYPGSKPLRAIHTRSDKDAWAVGSEGAVLHWNGLMLSRLAAPTDQPLQAVFAFSADNVFAVGMRGTILHYDGSSIVAYGGGGYPDGRDFRSVSGTSADDLWAVGDGNTIVHYTGQGWIPVPTGQPSTVNYRGVFAISPSEVWVVGNNAVGGLGVVLRWNGTNFTAMDTPQITATLNSVSGSSSANVWIGGLSGTILRYNGSNFLTYGTSTQQIPQIFAVAAVSPTDVWFGCGPTLDGSSNLTGCVLHWDGGSITLIPGVPLGTLTTAAVAAANDIWFAGYNPTLNGTVIRIKNGVPNSYNNFGLQYAEFYGIGVRSGTDVWVAGRNSTILHTTDGMNFTAVSSGILAGASSGTLAAITPAGATSMIAVGSQRSILRVLQ